MKYDSTTTLRAIRAAKPCQYGWEKLLVGLGKTKADDEPLPLLTVLETNGLDHALWVLSYAMPDDRLARHFQAGCVERVLHLFEAERPDDTRVRDQIVTLRDDTASDAARAAASDAACDAARAAASDAACDAAWVAASDAAWVAARAAASDAAWAAASDAARAAAWVAASDAAWVAASDAAWVAARAAQDAQLRRMIAGETK